MYARVHSEPSHFEIEAKGHTIDLFFTVWRVLTKVPMKGMAAH